MVSLGVAAEHLSQCDERSMSGNKVARPEVPTRVLVRARRLKIDLPERAHVSAKVEGAAVFAVSRSGRKPALSGLSSLNFC